MLVGGAVTFNKNQVRLCPVRLPVVFHQYLAESHDSHLGSECLLVNE